MTRESFLILLGILVGLTPFIGVPVAWLVWILPTLGTLIVVTSLIARHDRQARAIIQEDV